MPSRPAACQPTRAARRLAFRITVWSWLLAANVVLAQTDPGAGIKRWQGDVSATHDDNVTRANAAADERADTLLGLRLARDWDLALNPNTRLLLTLAGGGTSFLRYNRLSHAFGEAEATLEYRAEGSFGAPLYSAFMRLTGDQTRSTLRSGVRGAAGLRVSAALTDRLSGLASVAYERQQARSAVFAGERRSARLGLDYAVSNVGTLYGSAELRQGATTASGRASLDNIDIASVFVDDDAFADAGFLAYRFRAQTVVSVLGWNHGLVPDLSLDLSWQRAVSRPDATPPFIGAVRGRYVANQFVFALVKRF